MLMFHFTETANELRYGFPGREELEEMEGWRRKSRRSAFTLRHAWDDFNRNYSKNWKQFRQHQWKEGPK